MKQTGHRELGAVAEPVRECVQIESNAPTLTVAAIGEYRLRLIVNSGAEVRWRRYGIVRVVPLHLLHEVHRDFQAGTLSVDMAGWGRRCDTPTLLLGSTRSRC